MTYYDNGLRAGVGTAGNTAGTTGSVGGSILFAGGANITLSQSKSGANATVTIIGGAGAGGGAAISALGASASDGTVVFSNSNNVSFGMNGSTITATATFAGGGDAIRGIAANGSTASTNTVGFSNLNGVSFGFLGGASTSVITASHNALTSQSNQNVTAANGGFAFQTLSFSNANGVSFATSAGSAVVGSVATTYRASNDAVGLNTAQSNVTWTVNSSGISLDARGYAGTGTSATNASITLNSNGLAISVAAPGGGGAVNFSAGAAANDLQSVVFSNSNGLGFGLNGSTITGSYTVPTVTNSSWTVSDAATSGTVGRLAFTNLNGVTLSLSTGAAGLHTIVGSHNALTSQSNQNAVGSNGNFNFQTISFSNANGLSFGTSAGSAIFGSYTVPTVPAQFSGGNSNLGNTAGDTGVVTGRLVLVGTNGITLSGSTNAGSMTISISGGAGGGGNFSAGVSNVGNTAGSTGITGTRLVLVGTNGVTLSQSTDANGGTVSFSAAGGGAGAFSGGVSNLGNTAGATGITGTQNVFVGTGPISLSQTTGANGATISINAPATSSLSGTGGISLSTNGSTISIGYAAFTKSRFNPFMEAVAVVGQQGQGTMHIHPIPDPENFQFDRMLLDINWTHASNSTGSVTASFWAGLYTRNVDTLSLYASSSSTQGITFSGTANSSILNGPRLFSIGWTTTITQNDYWMGIISRTTSGGANASMSQFMVSDINSNFSGIWGSASNASAQNVLGLGVLSATTSSLPASVAFSNIRGTASIIQRVPLYYFLSGTA